MKTMLRLVVVWMMLSCGAGAAGLESGQNPPLICFVDKLENLGRNPIYVLGKDGKLYPVNDPAVKEKFWGREWSRRVEFWGDRHGRPAPGREKDFMRPKGPVVGLNAAGLKPHVEQPRVAVAAIPKDQGEDDDLFTAHVRGVQVETRGGEVDMNSLDSVTKEMSMEQKNFIESEAKRQADHHAWLRRQEKAKPPNAEVDREVAEAIRKFNARLGKPSGLMPAGRGQRMVYFTNNVGLMNIQVENGEISMETYLEMRKTEKAMEKNQRKMEKSMGFE